MTLVSFSHFSPERSCPRRVTDQFGAPRSSNPTSVLAKFKTGMGEMKILVSDVLWCVLGHWFRMGWHTCGVLYGDLLRQSSKQGCVR